MVSHHIPIGSFAGVRSHVRRYAGTLGEASIANRTPKRLLAGVRSNVRRQIGGLRETLVAIRTSVVCGVKNDLVSTKWKKFGYVDVIQMSLNFCFDFDSNKDLNIQQFQYFYEMLGSSALVGAFTPSSSLWYVVWSILKAMNGYC